MFTNTDLAQINVKGISFSTIEKQVKYFESGFPFMPLAKPAIIGDGMIKLSNSDLEVFKSDYEKVILQKDIVKFVPASGAASRMFKSLFTALEEGKFDKTTEVFFGKLTKFAFYNELQAKLNSAKIEVNDVNNRNEILSYLLTDQGLGYGSLPKGLLSFHQNSEIIRKPVEEHLVEGANYASNGKVINLHLTVSPEHKAKFEELLTLKLPEYENLFKVKYEISYSEQKASTDTIAVNVDNTPFREADGGLLFRPAGHGALLENLNDIDADIIFVKNIDNVVPDRLKGTTTDYKKALAGVLINLQNKIFDYIVALKTENPTNDLINEIDLFLKNELCIALDESKIINSKSKVLVFLEKLDRPLRVCGMVKNLGEPGGGPFWCSNTDGSKSLQIVESAQVNFTDDSQKSIFDSSTHFNPVDLVCATRNYLGRPFDLTQFSDPLTGFITEKSKDGKVLKAQELPGLWNGSMANWNTIFVEVPLITFNPVKTINDLLREEHS